MKNKHILIVDSHQIILEGIASILYPFVNINNILKAQTSVKALKLATEATIDIAIIDIALSDINDVKLIHELRAITPKIRIIIYTEHCEPWFIREIKHIGVDAIVLKNDNPQELIIAIESVNIGLTYYSTHFKLVTTDTDNTFTQREIDILQHVCLGLQSREIARRLCVSENTIEYHRKKLMRRLGATNNAHLAAIAITRGIIKPI